MPEIIVNPDGEVLLKADQLASYLNKMKGAAYWWDGNRTIAEITKFIEECIANAKALA